MRIGQFQLPNQLVLAPMAGISDRPFRSICKQFGVGLTVSEMVASNPELRHHKKTRLKADHQDESGLCAVQIVGTDPLRMAEAAVFNVKQGAQIIDINMGCPAKKVCAVAAGSALLKDPDLVKRILDAVVGAVAVPVTVKIRTGWDKDNRNATEIAKIAQNAGIAAITIHGRTRACKFAGQAEYDTIRSVKQVVNIPVIANGDIDSPEKAQRVLTSTGADGLMIGRGSQGTPWLFRIIDEFLRTGKIPEQPSMMVIYDTLISHLEKIYIFYGAEHGVKIARKHIGWYFKHVDTISHEIKSTLNSVNTPAEQLRLVNAAFAI